jgi:hypothetical protein
MHDKEFYERHINVCNRNIKYYEDFYNKYYNPYTELNEYNEYYEYSNIYGQCFWIHEIIFDFQKKIKHAQKEIKIIISK